MPSVTKSMVLEKAAGNTVAGCQLESLTKWLTLPFTERAQKHWKHKANNSSELGLAFDEWFIFSFVEFKGGLNQQFIQTDLP